MLLNDFSLEELQKLNFDGCYLAHYIDFKHGRELVFRSHVDAWPFFWCTEGNTIVFSDDFYSLASRFKTLTLNRDAIADYFEPGWNNIIKWDRTPFKEIHMLQTWTYMTAGDNEEPVIRSWKNLDTSIKFTEHNLEDFKRVFFECTDFYLKKIHDRYGKVIFSVSSGLDSSTLAARYVQLYPDNEVEFYTSKIDDVTDESKLAVKMESVLHKSIIIVNIRTDTFNYLELLKRHIDKNVPPRFNGLINEGLLCDEIAEMNITTPTVCGFGADGKFGAFGGEYLRFMYEILLKLKILKAYRTYKGYLRSYSDFDYEHYGNVGVFVKFMLMLARKIAGKIKRTIIKPLRKNKHDKIGLLNFSLPPFASSKIKTHKEALEYEGQEGGARDYTIEFMKRKIQVLMPFEGYRFHELSVHCDPFIFSDGISKACERYAVKGLLPDEILNNAKKSGNPAMTLQKSLNANNNLNIILDYIKGHESIIVNTEQLYRNFSGGNYGQKEFLSLCLLIFEEKITAQMGIKINI